MTAAPWTDLDRSPTAWRESGSGDDVVVFLHGLGGTRESWNPQLADLCDVRRCIAWDMPGYGASAPAATLTFEAIASRLVEMLDVIGAATADLVGLSFGGMHALHTALRYPDRIGRLLLADTSPAFGLDGTTAESWKRDRLGPLDDGLTPADIAEDVLDAISHRELEPTIRADLISGFSRISSEGLRAAVQCLPDHDVRSQLAQITHRTLVVVGAQDQETPVDYARSLADGLPNASLCVLDDVGHLSPSEAPLEFNERMRSFLLETP